MGTAATRVLDSITSPQVSMELRDSQKVLLLGIVHMTRFQSRTDLIFLLAYMYAGMLSHEFIKFGTIAYRLL